MNENQQSTQDNKQKTVFVGMSGGVDSSVSAALLKQQGYNVVGVFMKNWSGEDYGITGDCPWEKDQKDVEAVCNHIGIPFMSYNFEKEYRQDVVEYFFREYEAGRTPNPDVLCNREIKFKRFLKRALSEGADYIATGHYARNLQSVIPGLLAPQLRGNGNLSYHLLRGVDPNKDQTYFLHTFTQEQLRYVMFPVGHLLKTELRKIAKEMKIPTAEKKDSQGICFIGNIDVQDFLRSRIEMKPGDTVDADSGKIVGKHDGVAFYTIGQRKGLKIGGTREPYFVVDKDPKKNILLVGKGTNHPKLFKKELELENIHWISGVEPKLPLRCEVSVRYRQKSEPATFRVVNGKLEIVFDRPIRAISSGQSAVIYQGKECLGGGVIR